MIVDQVHVHDLAVLEAEHDALVAGGTNAPLARAVALQGMQPEAGRVGATRMSRLLQPEQDTAESQYETGRQPRGIVPLVQRSQSLVSDPHDGL